MFKSVSVGDYVCLVLVMTLTINPLASGNHNPKQGPKEWRGYKFKAQDIKKAKEECDLGGKPGPEFVSTVRDGEPNLALLEKATFKILNELGGWCPRRHCGKYIHDGFYNNCRSWIIGPAPSWGEIDLGGVATVNRVFIGSDHSQGFVDRVLADFDILVADKVAAEKSDAPSWKQVYTHKKGAPISKTTEIKFKEVRARWVRIHIRGANGARLDELEIYGGNNPMSLDPVGKLPLTWSQIKTVHW